MSDKSKQYWSMTEGVFNCLIDEERTKAFRSAIFNTVKKGDVVVDMGTGSGVLAMLAVEAGAKKVYAVEFDKNNIKTLNNTFTANNIADKIILLEGDVTKIKLPEKIDVIIGEMIATGLIEELQVPAVNNMLRFANKNVKVLLKRYKTYIDIVNNNEEYYGHKFKVVRYEYPDLKKLHSLSFSDRYLISDVDFTKVNKDMVVDSSMSIRITKNGVVNSIRISSDTIFFDDSVLGATFAYSYPIILPIKEIVVKKGDILKVDISYKLCGGMHTLHYSIKK